MAHVAAALRQRRRLGAPRSNDADEDADSDSSELDTDQHAYLRGILKDGEAARWRNLAEPAPFCLTELLELDARAPHMGALTALVCRHVKAAIAIGLPVGLPPVLLLGEPGTGKTWYLARLAQLLGVPFRRHPMNGQSMADSLCGSHPVWRNAQPGLVARTLLSEQIANPVVFVDEFDKAGGHHQRENPYRAFYDLLEPEGARAFSDEFLQFPIDASRVIWVMAGNDVRPLPAPIIDRLTIVPVSRPDEAQTRAVAMSVYDEANAARRRFFGPTLDEATMACLLKLTPRAIRKAVADAMTRAAAEGRRSLRPDDVSVE